MLVRHQYASVEVLKQLEAPEDAADGILNRTRALNALDVLAKAGDPNPRIKGRLTMVNIDMNLVWGVNLALFAIVCCKRCQYLRLEDTPT